MLIASTDEEDHCTDQLSYRRRRSSKEITRILQSRSTTSHVTERNTQHVRGSKSNLVKMSVSPAQVSVCREASRAPVTSTRNTVSASAALFQAPLTRNTTDIKESTDPMVSHHSVTTESTPMKSNVYVSFDFLELAARHPKRAPEPLLVRCPMSSTHELQMGVPTVRITSFQSTMFFAPPSICDRDGQQAGHDA